MCVQRQRNSSYICFEEYFTKQKIKVIHDQAGSFSACLDRLLNVWLTDTQKLLSGPLRERHKSDFFFKRKIAKTQLTVRSRLHPFQERNTLTGSFVVWTKSLSWLTENWCSANLKMSQTVSELLQFINSEEWSTSWRNAKLAMKQHCLQYNLSSKCFLGFFSRFGSWELFSLFDLAQPFAPG